MLLSIALILLCGMSMSWICKKLKLPGLLGMLLTGIVLGPYVLNLLDENILNISSELRKMALIIILMRAGLGLDISGLKKIGRPAVMMCFVPASFELLGMLVLAPRLLGLSLLEAAILGSVLAAVSPAVVVPRMVKLMEEGYGTEEGIPQLILAGASVDDVYVIVLFTTFTGIMQGKGVSVVSFLNIPVSIILGIVIGLLTGWFLAKYYEKVHIRDTVKVLIMLSISFLLVAAEDHMTTAITFSALIAVMFLGVSLQKYREPVAKRISVKCGKFMGGSRGILICTGRCDCKYWISVSCRTQGSRFNLWRTDLPNGRGLCMSAWNGYEWKEKLFTMMAYTPKATVQAAIGGIPLALGFACGDVVLTVAVLAIVLTAPLGAFAIDSSYKKFLSKTK